MRNHAALVAAGEHGLKAPCDQVLEIGTFTGFSAVAWYEGTRATGAETFTLDIQSEVLKTTSDFFMELGVDDRKVQPPKRQSDPVRTSSALNTIKGKFDLIFFDEDKENQKLYLDLILEQRLLSPKGVIFVDNGFNPFLEQRWRPFRKTAGETLRKVNQDFLDDPRVDTLMLPLFDGVTQMRWKEGFAAKRGSSF
ncbi:MAG: hypothetical protein L6R42_004371 [Xanthoria sp. 1 TBL-2021]|nr:MAG: hypothetical protein L6R42_004371 [Xanthoria sp. 1 TBL-2021]